ncbi:hypothetical protein TanjilG_02576 [Lupinus angustifolius]|uniref:BZIP domain-containing protein n=1 Tax=Lupinus angustifolius TaxID=3871 RepID=A0A4P1R8E4_LUPAN|nr:PREDICTED: protein ABSCISIC ACID-INSENSITIVE 5-like [Lupinus angustifolius]OIW05103.1 hypothetical protein TanjilG_02576 [Lupinus angustifolius]
MVIGDCEINSQVDKGEVESALQMEHHQGIKSIPSLGRQSSIYSLTLDEFQNTLVSENGKNFGSMNMDEFLTSIWNAEDNINQPVNHNHNHNHDSNNMSLTETASSEKNMATIRKQPSLPRQGSLTLPAPLCRKTVEQVWSEIHKQQQQSSNGNNSNNGNVPNTESAPRQPTFGEMTLEDFLVKAGVVRETCTMNHALMSHQQQQQQYGVYTNNNTTMPPYVIGGGVGNVVAQQPYNTVAQGVGELGNGKRNDNSVYHPPAPPPPPGICFPGGRVVNGGGGGYTMAVPPPPNIGIGGSVSPASSNENSAGQFGIEGRGRKRMVDGPVEKVVERRQRRMIKNRESAARSRARKQAYTVELEAELNILREENNQLKQDLAELERRRKEQCFEDVNMRVQTKAEKANEKLRAMRRNLSCPL